MHQLGSKVRAWACIEGEPSLIESSGLGLQEKISTTICYAKMYRPTICALHKWPKGSRAKVGALALSRS